MSGAMLACRRCTTSPAMLNKRSLGTLVAGMARTSRTTGASSGQREPLACQNRSGSSPAPGAAESPTYAVISVSTSSSVVVGRSRDQNLRLILARSSADDSCTRRSYTSDALHSIFLAYLLGMTIFYYDLTRRFLWPASRSYTFHFEIYALFTQSFSSFLKHANTILIS